MASILCSDVGFFNVFSTTHICICCFLLNTFDFSIWIPILFYDAIKIFFVLHMVHLSFMINASVADASVIVMDC